MGRKNRKGRAANQNPKRFYRERRGGARRRSAAAMDAALDANMESPFQLLERLRSTDLEPPRFRQQAPPRFRQQAPPRFRQQTTQREPEVQTHVCGRCQEWMPPQDALATARGSCMHPASGFSYPPAEMEACPFFR